MSTSAQRYAVRFSKTCLPESGDDHRRVRRLGRDGWCLPVAAGGDRVSARLRSTHDTGDSLPGARGHGDPEYETSEEFKTIEGLLFVNEVLARRVLERISEEASHRERLIALHLIWKLDGSPEAVEDTRPFWRAFAPASRTDEVLAKVPQDFLVYRVSRGLHAVFESGAVLVQRRDSATFVAESSFSVGTKSHEDASLEASLSRFEEGGKSPATLRRTRLEADARYAHDLALSRASVLPEFPELLDDFTRQGARRHFLRVVSNRGVDSRLGRLHWPWYEKAIEEVQGLANPKFTGAWEELSFEQIADLLSSIAAIAPASPALTHAALAASWQELPTGDGPAETRIAQSVRELRAQVDRSNERNASPETPEERERLRF